MRILGKLRNRKLKRLMKDKWVFDVDNQCFDVNAQGRVDKLEGVLQKLLFEWSMLGGGDYLPSKVYEDLLKELDAKGVKKALDKAMSEKSIPYEPLPED